MRSSIEVAREGDELVNHRKDFGNDDRGFIDGERFMRQKSPSGHRGPVADARIFSELHEAILCGLARQAQPRGVPRTCVLRMYFISLRGGDRDKPISLILRKP